jgi:hypothetical protein
MAWQLLRHRKWHALRIWLLLFLDRLRRAVPVVAFWLFLIAFGLLLVATFGYGIPWAIREDSVDRRLAATADVVGGATILLATFASAIALLAYFQSVRRPKLRLKAKLGEGAKDMVVSTVPDHSGNYKEVAGHPDSTLNLTLICENDVSARNPAVKVTFMLGLNGFQPAAGWSLSDHGTSGYKSAQWDGGTDYLVHGGWRRSLPGLPLGGARLTDSQTKTATIQVQWVADGIRGQSRGLVLQLQ